MNNMKSTEVIAEESTNEFDGNGFAPLIRLSGVTKVFLTDEVETHALSGIHLTFAKANIVPLLDRQAAARRRCFRFLVCWILLPTAVTR